MKYNLYYLQSVVGLAGMFCLGTIPVASAADPISDQERFQQQIGQEGSAMGVPEPGTVSDPESTKKKRNPSEMSSPESSAQATIGGAQYFVEGEVLKIDDKFYFVKKSDTGEEVRLIVNQDTNLDCAAAPTSRTDDSSKSETMTSERIPAEKQAPQASQQQIEQGQRKGETAKGGGFRIGQCTFRAGDWVKAEVDDMGRVTTLKYLAGLSPTSPRSIGPSAGQGELAIPKQDKPGQLDMTGGGRYTILPVPVGEFESSGGGALTHKPVKNLQGKQVGTLEDLIMDTATGRVEYAIIALEGTHQLHPVPWAALKLRNEQGALSAVIDTNQYQLSPDISIKDVKDLSPAIKDIVKSMQTLREQEPKKAVKRMKEPPAAGGEMGESEAGGAGPSGSRAMPSGKSSGFEGAKDKD